MPRMDKLSNYATTVAGDGRTMRVTYHSTIIVEWDGERIMLNTGGWRTRTTKQKMNQASNQFHLGYRVHAKDDSWFVTTPRGDVLPFASKTLSFTRSGELIPA